MHELSLTRNIVELALGHADQERATRILTVVVEIGALSGVIPEAVEFAFDVCTKETIAESASLEIKHIPGLGSCLDCGRQSSIDQLTHICPQCGSLALEIIQGQEMKFTEMEIE